MCPTPSPDRPALVTPAALIRASGPGSLERVVAQLVSPAVLGLETSTVQVEVDLRAGLPAFSVVGLPDPAVQEARERVRSGLANQAFAVPARRIVANLAPADLRKAGPQYDLPLALAILCASGQLAADAAPRRRRGGRARPRRLAAPGARRPGDGRARRPPRLAPAGRPARRTPPRPASCRASRSWGPATLRAAVDLLEGRAEPAVVRLDAGALLAGGDRAPGPDLGEVRGQGAARRALEVAAAGGHSMLMIGPPGAGKTMLARRLPGILPPLGLDEAIEVTRVHSVAGLLDPGCPLVVRRPFRAPHHTISAAGLVGGGRVPRPGEVSLAHRGVLFLDEVCAFAPSALDALRQPLEEGRIDVARAMVSARFPARTLLVCAGNPCPCGFDGDPVRRCVCPPGRAEAYRARLSGPVLDRIDLHVEVPRLARDEVLDGRASEPSAAVRARVDAARGVAEARGQEVPNAQLGPAAARRAAALPAGAAGAARAGDRPAGAVGARPRSPAARGADDRRPRRLGAGGGGAPRRGPGLPRAGVRRRRRRVTGAPDWPLGLAWLAQVLGRDLQRAARRAGGPAALWRAGREALGRALGATGAELEAALAARARFDAPARRRGLADAGDRPSGRLRPALAATSRRAPRPAVRALRAGGGRAGDARRWPGPRSWRSSAAAGRRRRGGRSPARSRPGWPSGARSW